MKAEFDDTPLYYALMAHNERRKFSFHVPGHRNGEVFFKSAKKTFAPLLAIDQTELSGLDDLHDPHGAIAEAQKKTASFYRVKNSYFLVGGSTVGNLAMILAACEEGDIVFVQRNSHRSILNGIRLAKAVPVFLTPDVDEKLDIATAVSEETLKEAFAAYPEVKAVILTHPNYYGNGSDLRRLIAFAHKKNVPVLVDEAHGAHFILGEPFPLSAIEQGADAVVHSAHKTLPAMTMASYLHYNSELVNKNKLEMYLRMLQSSSPSYPLMASLDLARHYMSELTRTSLERILASIEQFKRKLNEIPQLQVVESKRQDALKVIVASRSKASGFELQQRLEQRGIFVELADERHVLFVLPLAPLTEVELTIQLIKKAVKGLEPIEHRENERFYSTATVSTLALSYEQLSKNEENIKTVPLSECVNQILAEDIVPYPPGIPVILKGERASERTMSELLKLAKAGARFQGHNDLLKSGVKIYVEEKR